MCHYKLKLKDMFKINLEDYRINQYRLFHSRKFQGLKFIKSRNKLSDDGDLSGEKQIITEYLTEKNEMDFTYYMVLRGISFGLGVILGYCLLMSVTLMSVTLPILIGSVIFYLLSDKYKNDFIMGEMGIDMSESFYNEEIRKKFNL